MVVRRGTSYCATVRNIMQWSTVARYNKRSHAAFCWSAVVRGGAPLQAAVRRRTRWCAKHSAGRN
eukprot:4399320-Alexandrium_andersonii.AAC.1